VYQKRHQNKYSDEYGGARFDRGLRLFIRLRAQIVPSE